MSDESHTNMNSTMLTSTVAIFIDQKINRHIFGIEIAPGSVEPFIPFSAWPCPPSLSGCGPKHAQPIFSPLINTLEGLPATYVEEENEADTVRICLIDKTLSCQVELQYTLFNQLPVLTRSMKIIHSGTEKIRLEAAMSFSLELPDKEYEMLTLTGAWGRERHIQNVPLHQGIQSIYSLRGHSSHNYNPFIGLKRKETTEFLGEAIGFSLVYSGNFLAQAEVDTYDVTRIYVKWDMNRSMSEVFSQGRECDFQGRVYHQYILGIYELYERLTSKFPEVLFESCASGGGRFDPGMLYYSPQGWISDNTDAVERLKTQYGTSMVHPLSNMGSHVSAVPNHQTSRSVSLNTRGSVAYFGTFGYELDISQLSDEEKATVQEQITFMKKSRGLMARGTFYRLASPFQGNETVWMVRSRDRSQAIVGYYRILTKVNDGYRRLKLAGLDPHKKYRIAHLGEHGYFGDELMEIGIVLNDHTSGDYHSKVPRGDFLSRIFILEAD
ncbi:alpha-galactosidase [Paenibacillus sp. FSL L8-0436]|uniref:alpha-galactosidase n=1 Tax=Paenibacillus sp. FSL L8-0436 TaxID=2954686 RepID=UPI003158761C